MSSDGNMKEGWALMSSKVFDFINSWIQKRGIEDILINFMVYIWVGEYQSVSQDIWLLNMFGI